jgi:hypothetical protein
VATKGGSVDLKSDIEFLSDDGRVVQAGDDDVVEFNPSRVPGWVGWIGAMAVAAAVIGLIAAQGEPKQPVAPALPEPSSVVASGSVPPPLTSGLGVPLPLGRAEVYDAVLSSGTFYFVQDGELSAITPIYRAAPRYARTRQIFLPSLGEATPTARLVLDAGQHRLWVVVEDVPGGAIVEVDALTLRPLAHWTWREPVGEAAALDGHLYLSTPSGVVDIAPGAAKPAPVAALRGYSGSIVADPGRGRVLVLSYAPNSHVRVLRPNATVSQAPGVLGFAKATMGVTADGVIWAAGFGTHGAQLVRLDPDRLSATTVSPLAKDLGPGAVIVGAGDRSVWVRDGGTLGPLWCVDARSGAGMRQWDVTGTVTSQTGRAYVTTDTLVRPLILNGCAG